MLLFRATEIITKTAFGFPAYSYAGQRPQREKLVTPISKTEYDVNVTY